MSSHKTLVIIVNWNKADVLDTMLSSLEASGPREYDAVLVDNASTDNSVAMVREKYPWIHILENKENLGGTGGFNCGMVYGLRHPNNYEFLWLLDNDVYIHAGAFRALMQPMLDEPKVGMVGSAILLMDDPSQVQEAGIKIVWNTGAFERNGAGNVADLAPKALLESDFVPACSCLVRVQAVKEVGIWDPAYFLLWDDIDWGVRFVRAGWRVVAATDSLVRHESYNNRRAKGAAWQSYLWLRNALYTFRQHGLGKDRLPLFFTAFRLTLAFLDNDKSSGRIAEWKAMQRGIRDFFDGTMGKPPQEVYAPAPKQEVLPADQVTNLRSIAILVTDNPEMIRTMYDQLQADFPGAKISCLLTRDQQPELVAAKLPNEELVAIDTIFKRLLFAIRLGTRFDAVANPYNQPQFLYVKFAKVLLQFTSETAYYATRRRLTTTLALFAKRPFIWLRAAWLAFRAWRMPPAPVDYHFWRT